MIKKILSLFIIFLFLGGCYDYSEINDLAIITAIGIDKKNNNYIVTYELLSDNLDKNSANIKSYTITQKGTTLTETIKQLEKKIIKKAYYAHADVVLLSENVLKNNNIEVIDTILRNPKIRENFALYIVDNPQKTLKNTTDQMPIIGTNIINNFKKQNTNKLYKDVINEVLSFGKDTTIPKIKISNNTITLEGLAIFNNFKIVDYLDTNETSLYYLLNNNTNSYIQTKKYNDKDISVNINDSNIKINIDKKKILITGSIYAEVINNSSKINLNNDKELLKIEKYFQKELNNNTINLFKKIQNKKSDIFALSEKYYINTRNKNKLIWLYSDIDSNIKFNITKKGIINEVTNHE